METDDTTQAWDLWLVWRDVWLSAVALAWRNEQFKRDLLKDPRRALEQQFNYQLPWQMELIVKEGEGQWDATTDGRAGKWNDLSNMTLTIPLPPAPAAQDAAIALANYSSLGRAYPFSTCC
ncbi:hypothetical protein SOCEGT47_043220 [Sorangium cellulosum]|jgi:ribosomally synthesized peptide (two-chain TOMM family)|uniref:Uncharacterized protein n=1 Tax=Sorangium cellulosum TaxID=56 RepID=A0A4V0NDT5_SORCE|nr:BMA_0021/BMA_0022 family TOMM bacteriocin [Sorangium cellulosum]AUX23792.1 hypothetical protein SOCEGT47_043220 [Sorangium cellulosum]